MSAEVEGLAAALERLNVDPYSQLPPDVHLGEAKPPLLRVASSDGPLVRLYKGYYYEVEETNWHRYSGVNPLSTFQARFPADEVERKVRVAASQQRWGREFILLVLLCDLEPVGLKQGVARAGGAEDGQDGPALRGGEELDFDGAIADEGWGVVERILDMELGVLVGPKEQRQAILDLAALWYLAGRFKTLTCQQIPPRFRGNLRRIKALYSAADNLDLCRVVYRTARGLACGEKGPEPPHAPPRRHHGGRRGHRARLGAARAAADVFEGRPADAPERDV